MPRILNCECGLVCEGETDEELLKNAERHVAEHHPELVGRISRNDLLAMAEAAPPNWRPATPRSDQPGGGTFNAHIVCEREGPVATVILDRSERRNALSLELIEELADTFEELGRDTSIRVVVLGARGPAFCAGHDLVEMRGKDEAFFNHLYGSCTEMMTTIHHLPQPVIARVQGTASAGGCHLVAACDLVVAAAEARFAVPGPRIGLPGTTAMVEVTRVVGTRRAMELLLTGDPIDAMQAKGWGLVNYVVEGQDLEEFTSALAHRVAAASRGVLSDAKRTLYEAVAASRPDAYRRARDAMARSSAASDGQEGIAAFLEKRGPAWPSET